jgi:hypothetical protein
MSFLSVNLCENDAKTTNEYLSPHSYCSYDADDDGRDDDRSCIRFRYM